MSIMRFALSAIAASAAVLSMGAAQAAGTATSNFNVNLTVQSKCVITNTTVTDINLGSFDVGATPAVGNTKFNLKCTKGTPYTISLSPTNAGGTDNTGKLKASGTDTIDYALFSNAGATAAWGKTSLVSGTFSTSSSAGVDISIYAKVATVPDVPVGTYTDNVQITVNY